jgi:ribose transport system permease protein
MSNVELERAATSPARTAARAGLLRGFGSMREFGLVLIILALCIVMSFASPYFLTWPNFKAMLLSFSIEGIVVVGMTVLLIVGAIDLSVGSVVCFAMVVGGFLFLAGLDPWSASALAIVACAGVGVLMALCVTRIGLHPFIASLAFMVIVRGLCLAITGGTPLSLFSLPPSFKFVGQGTIYEIPFVIIIFVLVVAIFDLLLRKATLFRNVFYTGSNEKAAAYSGIRTNRVKFFCIVLCSTLAGLAGVIYMARFGAATPTFGLGMELNIIAAAVIGGASLNGGSGSILGAILGIALLSIVSSSLILLDVSPYWQDMIRGLILLAAVSFDHFLHRSKGTRRVTTRGANREHQSAA